MPLESVVVLSVCAPVKFIVTPDNPDPVNVTWPAMLYVGLVAVAVKSTSVRFAPLTVCALLAGLKEYPVMLGVIV